MSKPEVLIAGSVRFAQGDLDKIAERFTVHYLKCMNRAQFFELCKTKYQNVKALYRHPDSTPSIGDFNEELLNNLPKSVKFICNVGAGYDTIDVATCAKLGIYLSNTPGAVDAATADIAVILILNACRNISQSERVLRQGQWNAGIFMGMNPEGKKLGILGMGGIGKAIAQRVRGFEMEILYHNRSRLSEEVEKKYNAKYVDFETLLRTSDVISVSVPLSGETYHLIGNRELAMCKDGVIIVNTARGKVIDEPALVKALESGKVAAVGLDVFEEEPKIHPGLLVHPRSTLLPHIGTNTIEAQIEMEQLALNNLIAAVDSDKLITPVWEHKKYFA
ncbi:hypothetical protein INT44_009263 [Umbelopsis vinacea]|uniref:Uncharacterized protein n=1 Tax=Umbelopsis vinacea TaxID=44442 RepID=A0A8H7Q1L9_9FUNG|nr:hypothetical protein INT44_009263 [Umbelopsis vinacea]